MREIRWSQTALEDVTRIFEYLESNFTKREQIKFSLKISKILKSIAEMPELFPMSTIGSRIVRRGVISEQTTLFYEVFQDHILLLRFKDNRGG